MALDRDTRTHVRECRAALPETLPEATVAFGFDGIVDRVRTAVAERAGPDEFEPMTSVAELGTRITDSAAQDASCSVEWFSRGSRAGGHVSHLGRAFERLGANPTLVGTFGDPPADTFREEFDHSRLVSIGSPSTTDAIEFDDGKVMLSDTRGLAAIDWGTVREEVGLETLADHVDGSAVLGTGYLATIPRLPTIWRGLASDIWPLLDDPPAMVLVDPGDLRRLNRDRIRAGAVALADLDRVVDVTVSANRPETRELADLFGIAREDDSIEALSGPVREELSVSRFVAHSVTSAAAATGDRTVSLSIPRCREPALTTSAGDHFNAGLALARVLGVRDGPALVVAAALAGRFVRTGTPPTFEELRSFVRDYEDYFDDP